MPHSNVDLTNCDKEPIHTPGSIQAHGCLLACSADGGRVLRCSENAEKVLGLSASPLDKPLAQSFDGDLVHEILNAMAKSTDPRRPGLLRSVAVRDDARFDIAVHRFNGAMIVEFEPAGASANADPLELVRALIAKTQLLTDHSGLNASLPRFLQALLGYDRVMIYEFAADGSGKVVGEARKPDLEPFLGQHFPAADIPKQARALYLKNTLRVITDAKGPASAIVPALDASGEPLDLSFAHLRSVSPIHLEYLRNMGVGASMSISIIVGGELWGLVACHHYAPKILTMTQRVGAELYGDFLSLHLTSMHHRRRAEATLRTRSALDRLLTEMSFHQDVGFFLRDSLSEFAKLVACDGVGLWLNGVWSSHGSAPPPEAAPRLARVAAQGDGRAVMATHAISERWPEAESFAAAGAGMMAVPLSVAPRDYLFFFRKEKVQTLDWAGDPNKSYSTGPNGDRLTPRQSFAVWKQIVEGQSDSWTEDERIVGDALLVGLREVILRNVELLTAERKKAELRLRVLNDELNHRVKNILALIKSLVSHPVGPGEDLGSYVAGLKGRILALSHAHDQVVRSDGGGSLHQLLRAELSPYPGDQIELKGDDVGLDSRSYSVMALVLHELATNAAKYGALSVEHGRLSITTGLDAQGDCAIHWLERGGPAVKPPQRQGFGSVLLDRSVPFDLQGTSEIRYAPEGVEVRFALPAKFLNAVQPRRLTATTIDPGPASAEGLQSTSILLLEDQLVIALDAEDMLKSLGVAKVTTVATAEDALKEIAAGAHDLAVLDFNLGSGSSLAVAQELSQRGVPFVFATGYSDSIMIPDNLTGVPVVRKPYSAEALKSALKKVARPGPKPVA